MLSEGIGTGGEYTYMYVLETKWEQKGSKLRLEDTRKMVINHHKHVLTVGIR